MVIAVLGAIVSILILLNRLAEAGIDLGGLNPFLWGRRRKWKKQYEGDPVFKVKNPMEATALLMVGVAKSQGDMTRENKRNILSLFESEFKLSKKDAVSLLIASTHLHGSGEEFRKDVNKILKPSLESFSETQAESAMKLVTSVAEDANDENTQQLLIDIIQVLDTVLVKNNEESWS